MCIEANNLTNFFQGRTVVDGLTFRVEKGEVFGLLGHNGAFCGKNCCTSCRNYADLQYNLSKDISVGIDSRRRK